MRYSIIHIFFCTLAAFGASCALASAQNYLISDPIVRGNLAVYAIRGEESAAPAPITLEQALANGTVRVYDENPRPLTVENLSDRPVFIQFGDLLKGGAQDQVAAESLLVQPGSRAPLNVFCVDPFRSVPRSAENPKAFTASTNLLPSRIAELAMLTNLSITKVKDWPKSVRLRQLGVWWSLDTLRWSLSQKLGEELEPTSDAIQRQDPVQYQYVNQLLRARRSPSITGLPLGLESLRIAKAIEPYLDLEPAVTSDRKVIGAVFAINGVPVAGEIYQSNDLFRQMLPKLLRAHAVEAIATDPRTVQLPSTDAIRDFLHVAHDDLASQGDVRDGFQVHDRDAGAYIELNDNGGWVHRGYVGRLHSDADPLAPEAVVLGILETDRINDRSISGLTKQDRVVLQRDPSNERWSATIEGPTPRHGPAFSIAVLLALFAIPSAGERLVIWLRARRNRVRRDARQSEDKKHHDRIVQLADQSALRCAPIAVSIDRPVIWPCSATHTSLEHVANIKLAPDLSDIDGFARAGKTQVARDDEQQFESAV